MANDIRNRIEITGTKEQIKEIINFLKGEDTEVDFNSITPTPKWVYQGNLGSKELEKYGEENCWYDWRVKNWGTKWNAYDCLIDEEHGVIEFSTAWNGVPNLISKLGVIFPNVYFFYKYADENVACNVGLYTIKDTTVNSVPIVNRSANAFEIYFDLWGESERELYEYDEKRNTYIYKGE